MAAEFEQFEQVPPPEDTVRWNPPRYARWLGAARAAGVAAQAALPPEATRDDRAHRFVEWLRTTPPGLFHQVAAAGDRFARAIVAGVPASELVGRLQHWQFYDEQTRTRTPNPRTPIELDEGALAVLVVSYFPERKILNRPLRERLARCSVSSSDEGGGQIRLYFNFHSAIEELVAGLIPWGAPWGCLGSDEWEVMGAPAIRDFFEKCPTGGKAPTPRLLKVGQTPHEATAALVWRFSQILSQGCYWNEPFCNPYQRFGGGKPVLPPTRPFLVSVTNRTKSKVKRGEVGSLSAWSLPGRPPPDPSDDHECLAIRRIEKDHNAGPAQFLANSVSGLVAKSGRGRIVAELRLVLPSCEEQENAAAATIQRRWRALRAKRELTLALLYAPGGQLAAEAAERFAAAAAKLG